MTKNDAKTTKNKENKPIKFEFIFLACFLLLP
jgi:hypothetical protein